MANTVSQGSVGEESEEEDSEDDEALHGFMARTERDKDLEIRAHFEYAELYKDSPKIYAISDGGADSCVLGKHAHVIHETGRYATLVGYDPQSTRSKRIPIVTAYLKTIEPNSGFPVLLKINEAPFHSNNPITLISEYQVREYGYVIDSVATKHKKGDNAWGTQRLESSKDIHIPFVDRGGIMGFEILPITKDDFDENGEPLYDVFELTGPKQWTPARFRKVLHQQEEADNEDELYFFDPIDALPNDSPFSPATIDFDFSSETFPNDKNEDKEETFLSCLSYNELVGLEVTNPEYYGFPPLNDNVNTPDPDACNEFHTLVYAVSSWHRVLYDEVDPRRLQPYLAFRPLDIVKATLRSTTQLARMVIRYPLRRHYKSRAPFLNVHRLDEVVFIDPMFANCPSLHHGSLGAQVFY